MSLTDKESPCPNRAAGWLRVRLLACGMLLAGTATGLGAMGVALAHGAPSARTAGAESLNESTYLNLTKVSGNKIAGRGRAVGTIVGTGAANMTLVSGTKAVGEFTGGNSHGSVSGKFVASYRVSGAVSYFTGSVTSVHGSGKYSGAYGLGIKFSGSMNRVKLTMSLTVAGKWHS